MGIFVMDIDEILTLNKEFLVLVYLMDATTAIDVLTSLVGAPGTVREYMAHALNRATDGILCIIRKKAGVCTWTREEIHPGNG